MSRCYLSRCVSNIGERSRKAPTYNQQNESNDKDNNQTRR